ncbi:unnamed protein product [Didymodactylos carnosus]|uniref:Uncharacterized protein n=1 Tax=Didymodactylos carnosus TaxID=1234261 RepID=A0A813S272_9BILA|nr:unnamed protein product [Didymodactylos carnosus]CAF1111093.1 unnamed protein product [Didymodactylos carnosus]CAF3575382.1 unnamed protein product [Didymodactylos carnosus]CAF3878816.1 unnamed protein product [Didymodactylos carnosus]
MNKHDDIDEKMNVDSVATDVIDQTYYVCLDENKQVEQCWIKQSNKRWKPTDCDNGYNYILKPLTNKLNASNLVQLTPVFLTENSNQKLKNKEQVKNRIVKNHGYSANEMLNSPLQNRRINEFMPDEHHQMRLGEEYNFYRRLEKRTLPSIPCPPWCQCKTYKIAKGNDCCKSREKRHMINKFHIDKKTKLQLKLLKLQQQQQKTIQALFARPPSSHFSLPYGDPLSSIELQQRTSYKKQNLKHFIHKPIAINSINPKLSIKYK